MSSVVVNPTPFLRTSREFPIDNSQELGVQLTKSYLDIANNVNARTIGIYPTNSPAITGNSFFLAGKRLQELRRVYQITGAGNYPHGIDTVNFTGFSQIYGTFTDGTIWYPLPYVNAVAANNQVSLTVDATNIIVTVGGGAPPTISSGFVVLSWISEF